MKDFNYNETDNTIEIKDDIKMIYLLYKILITLNIISASIQLFNLNKSELSLEIIIWSTIGAFSFIIGLFLFLKRSIQQKIPIDAINGLSKSNILGRSKYSIELKNGKKRELPNVKTQGQFKEVQKMFDKIGVGV